MGCAQAAADRLLAVTGDDGTFVKQIKTTFVNLAERINDDTSANLVKREHLMSNRASWSLIKTSRTCLICCLRFFEHFIPCGHCLCETCVDASSRDQGLYSFVVDSCELCATPAQVRVDLKPPTLAPSLLSIDGGGIRGIGSLEFLRQLQVGVGNSYPIQDYFDSVVATSAGEIDRASSQNQAK